MGTALDIINDSTRLIGVKQKGEALDGDESADALRRLNLLVDSWANEKLMLAQLIERTHSLTSGTGSYTIGSGGTINTTWPIKIERAFTRDSNNLDTSIEIIDNKEWARISLKNTSGLYPAYLYYRRAYPLGTIELYPLPGSGLTLYLEVWDQLTQFTNLSTSASFPPGYERALIYNLAVELAPEYGAALRPEIYELAKQSKADIKTANLEVPRMACDLPIGYKTSHREYFPII